jgi:DNA polymerase-1
VIEIDDSQFTDFKQFLKQDNLQWFTSPSPNGEWYLVTVPTTEQTFKLPANLYNDLQDTIPLLVTTLEDLYKVDSWIDGNDEIALDTETDGLSRFRKCLGVSFSNGHEYFYIPLLKWTGDQLADYHPILTQNQFRSRLKSILSKNKKWIGHNIVFDAITLNNAFGVNIIDNVYCDTAVLHHTCISEDPPHGLKVLATKYIDSNASDAQSDLEESVKKNGGQWKKDQKDFYKADVPVLGKYAALDPYYTYKLYELWYPEIKKQKLEKLWNEEALPLTKVVYELNTSGLCLEPGYFENLKNEVSSNIKQIELDIINSIKDVVTEYEYKSILDDVKITSRSELGKLLQANGLDVDSGKDFIINWYKNKKNISQIFNLDSKDDLAFLLFDVLNLPVIRETKSGKRAVDKATIDKLIEDNAEDSDILKKIKVRNKEIKLLNTYIEPILENSIAGRIYPQFNQIGTSSGRFTSSEPINFQTLPRDDLRIKKGFVPDKGWVIVNADFSSLEPRAFAAVSNEPEIKRVYSEGLDLYSHVHIMVSGDKTVSAREEDSNFLKNVNKDARQAAKTYTLGFAYQMSEYKYASTMNVPVEEAKQIKDQYFKAFPNLKKYQDECNYRIATDFYVTNLMGRKRRAKLIPLVRKLYPKANLYDKYKLMKVYEFIVDEPEYIEVANKLKSKGKPIKDARDFSYAIRSEFNNSSNFPIQGLAASITNASCVELYTWIKQNNLKAKFILQVHDEITLMCPEEEADEISQALKYFMEKNKVAQMIDVEMKADPIIAMNLAESK